MTAPRAGYLARCDALDLGMAAMRLGAGRERKEDAIDPGVGISLMAKVGERVEAGQPLASLAWSVPERLEDALPLVRRAFQLVDEQVPVPTLIREEVR